MIKNLALATLTALTPFKIVWNVNNYTFNKTQEQTYILGTTSNQNWGDYAYLSSDNYNILNGVFENKTTVIRNMEIDNDRHDLRVRIFVFEDNISNGTKYIYNRLQYTTITNYNDINLYEYISGSMTLTNTSWQGELTTVKNALQTKYTNPYSIRNQITTCHNACMSTGNYDDGYVDLRKADNPTTFYQQLQDYYLEGNSTIEWSNEDDNDNDEFAPVKYIEMRFNFEGNYEDLATTTKQSLYDSFLGVRSSIEINLKTEQAPIVVSGDIVDIPGLIFTILGMPFAWISTAFNLTLFPGTPYSINIAYIFMGVIGLLIAIFIIRKLIK